jgi:predicted PurR-regulated permease PerM
MPAQLKIKTTIYLLMGVTLALVVHLHLGPALIAGFLSYLVLDLIYRLLLKWTRPFYARWAAFAVFLLTAGLMVWLLVAFIGQSLAAVPDILEKSFPRINELSQKYGFDLTFTNMEELRDALLLELRKNAGSITHSSQILTREFFHLLVGLFIAILVFLDWRKSPPEANLFGAFREEMGEQVGKFTDSFERVIGAQVAISAVNTCLTGLFLVFMGFPYLPFLVLTTFLVGILPIVGNLISNTIIVITGLTLSPEHALSALIFLIVVHKLEYFLNSKIVGANIRTPMWQTLLGILLGHTLMGIPGIILAPALLHYVRGQMRSFSAKAGKGTRS